MKPLNPIPVLAFAAALLSTTGIHAQTPPSGDPLKVFMIGNSLTDEVRYDAWVKLCRSSGGNVLVARKMIPGSGLDYHRNNPTSGFLTPPFQHPEEAFKNHPWDVLTLQPFAERPAEIEAAHYYADLMWTSNPDARVFVYAQWPDRGSGTDWQKSWDTVREARYLPLYSSLKQGQKAGQVFLIPVGHVMERLDKKGALGLVPGLRSAWDLYSDGIHTNNIGSYLVGLTFYATIFGKSPLGAPVGEYQGQMGSDADYLNISPDLAQVLQETVWEAVTGLAESGVSSDLPPALTLPQLVDAVDNEPYINSLDAAFGRPPYTFAIAGGSLPMGLTLQSDGCFKGSPSAIGESDFTAKVTDSAGASSTKDYHLKVAFDSAPKITTAELPPLRQGEYVDTQLGATEGNGHQFWTVAEGLLPTGLRLEPSGRLTGSPGISGNYQCSLQVEDGDVGKPEKDIRSYSVQIAIADPSKVFLVPQATSEIKIDGILDPSEGWNLERELARPIQGKPNNKVRFDARWKNKALYVAVEVVDERIVADSSHANEGLKQDCLTFYFDGLNNREDTYNFDDFRFAFRPNPSPDIPSFLVGSPITAQFKYQLSPTGYTAEIQFNLEGVGVPLQLPHPIPQSKWSVARAGAVFGFEIESRDLDELTGGQSILGWQGSITNPENPGQYGTMILQP